MLYEVITGVRQRERDDHAAADFRFEVRQGERRSGGFDAAPEGNEHGVVTHLQGPDDQHVADVAG